MGSVTFEALDCGIRFESEKSDVLELVKIVYGGMPDVAGGVDLLYLLDRRDDEQFVLNPAGREPLTAADPGTFLWEIDGTLAVDLQRLRRDLYFVHAAVLGYEDDALLFVGQSGAGKSSLAWTLVNRQLVFLSDELAPVDLSSLSVLAYPRALDLKAPLGPPVPSSFDVLRTDRSLHIATACLPSGVATGPRQIRAIFCVSHTKSTSTPRVSRISSADAATRLYVSTLNPLAHPSNGLDGAVRLAASADCFDLVAGELEQTADAVLAAVR